MTQITMRDRIANAWEDVFQRGLEFALAGSFIINGRSVFAMRQNGEPLAPFLTSALSYLSPNPIGLALFLILAGITHFAALLISMRTEKFLARALMSFLALIVYAGVTLAVATGKEPSQAAERYGWSAFLAFICVVYLGARAVAEFRGKGGFKA